MRRPAANMLRGVRKEEEIVRQWQIPGRLPRHCEVMDADVKVLKALIVASALQ